jgi:hypothetical protein
LGLLAASRLLGGCGEAVPIACADMCHAAAVLYGACLDDWGVGWEAAGYADESDFVDACDTWAWEQAVLERDAGREGQLEATCEARRSRLEGGTCDDFTEIDWEAPLAR